MKKLIAPLALVGFFATMIGTSYAAPAAQPVNDDYSKYDGDTTAVDVESKSYVIHLEYNGYVLHLEWSNVEVAATGTTTGAGDQLFDR
jgi:hypothetical protein